jgi:hypothetical protein
MPRKAVASNQNPSVIHQTIEIPSQNTSTPPANDGKPDFFTYMQSLTPEQWKEHIIYLTRENPKTSINGVGGYLTKLQQPFEIEDIKTAYGGYEFSYIMKKDNTIVYSGRFRVEAPPRYDSSREYPSAQPSSNGNGSSGGDVLRVLEQQNQRLYEVLTELQGKKDENPAISSAVDILTTAYKSGVTAVRESMPLAGDTQKQVSDLLTTAEKLANLRGNPFDLGGFLEKLVANPLIAPLITRLISPPDPIAELAKLGAAMDVLEKIRGGNGNGGRSDWRSVLAEKAVEALPQVLDTVKQNREASLKVAEENRATAEMRERTAKTIQEIRTHPAPSPPPAVGAPQPSTVTPLRTVPLNGTTPAETATPTNGQTVTTEDVVADWIKHRIVAGVQLGTDPEAIVDFLDVADPSVCDQLVAYPAEVVTGFLQNDPILQAAVNHPNWSAFFAAARTYILAEEPETAVKPN